MTTATVEIEFTPDQLSAQEAFIQFVRSKEKLFTIGGFAGTGKTTVIASAIKNLKTIKKFKDIKIAFCCFTGKAATVLRDKLQNAGAASQNDYCGTIHGLIYKPIMENDRVIGWSKVSIIDADLIVIDEASMVGDTIFEDLKSYGVPIVAVGDHGQLPPIMSKYNLMERPMVRLEKIHRQAEGNPIIHWSMLARTGEKIPYGRSEGMAEYAQKITGNGIEQMRVNVHQLKQWMVLCGINKTRVMLNSEIRKILGQSGDPRSGEKIICLKNNRREKIFNGMVGELKEIKEGHNEDFFKVNVKFDLMGFQWYGDIFSHQFNKEYTLKEWPKYEPIELGNLFDFGYAITVHKSQGSQAETVMLIEERMRSMSDDTFNRWLYTGITRASKNLIIVSDK